MSSGWLEVAREAVRLPALLSDVYGDLLRPGVKQVGRALETVVGLGNTILWPVALANEKARIALDKNLEKYRAQMENVPEEEVVNVPPEIGVPIAEKLAYVTDEELSDLYVNLLAKASTKETAKFAHPSFVNVINNLSPDEALILKDFHTRVLIPFVTAQLTKKESSDFRIAGDVLTGVETRLPLSFPQNVVAYLSNLEGLGLIQIRRDLKIVQPDLYDTLEAAYKPACEKLNSDRETLELKFVHGKIDVTPFGKIFMNACLTKLKDFGSSDN